MEGRKTGPGGEPGRGTDCPSIVGPAASYRPPAMPPRAFSGPMQLKCDSPRRPPVNTTLDTQATGRDAAHVARRRVRPWAAPVLLLVTGLGFAIPPTSAHAAAGDQSM